MKTKNITSAHLGWVENILNNYLQEKLIPMALNNIFTVNKKTHTKFPSLVLTKSHTTYNQQNDQNRLQGEGFQ